MDAKFFFQIHPMSWLTSNIIRHEMTQILQKTFSKSWSFDVFVHPFIVKSNYYPYVGAYNTSFKPNFCCVIATRKYQFLKLHLNFFMWCNLFALRLMLAMVLEDLFQAFQGLWESNVLWLYVGQKKYHQVLY